MAQIKKKIFFKASSRGAGYSAVSRGAPAEANLPCAECARKFKTRAALIAHYRMVHGHRKTMWKQCAAKAGRGGRPSPPQVSAFPPDEESFTERLEREIAKNGLNEDLSD